MEKARKHIASCLAKMAVSCVSIERMSPEELALWLTDKGFDEEVGKAFIVWIHECN